MGGDRHRWRGTWTAVALLQLLGAAPATIADRSCPAQSLSASELPSTGFVVADVAGDAVALRIKQRTLSHQAPFCTKIRIVHQPTPNDSPLMGANEFTALPTLFNGHFAWSNGPEAISFVPHADGDGSQGNWLLGTAPGVDNGYVYRTAPAADLSPLRAAPLADGDDDDAQPWHWLLHQQWQPQPQMFAACADGADDTDDAAGADGAAASREYFEVEFFAAEDDAPRSGLLFAALPAAFRALLGDDAAACDAAHALHLWDAQAAVLRPLTVTRTLAAVGSPVRLVAPAAADAAPDATGGIVSGAAGAAAAAGAAGAAAERRELGVLVGAELAGARGWRLFFHLLPPHEPPLGARNASAPQRSAGFYRVDELYVELDAAGRVAGGVVVEAAPLAARRRRQRQERDVLRYATLPGDFVWLWETRAAAAAATPAAVAGDASPHEKVVDGAAAARAAQVDEVLVVCTQRRVDAAGRVALSFASFPAHRQRQMAQSMAQRLVSHYTVVLPPEGDEDGDEDADGGGNGGVAAVLHSFAGGVEGRHHARRRTAARWTSLVFLSAQPATFVVQHLRWKEHRVGARLSSCFLYHAAVTLPAPLVYAAELLCVLLGSKPLAMVQLSSPSEHQWKFPLVAALARAVVETVDLHRAAAAAAGAANASSSFPVDYAVFTFGEDETLVVYRAHRRYLMEALRPRFTAQALHPMPFPSHHRHDADALRRAHREQLYNAAWNGLALGYPPFFVRAYVDGFHDNDVAVADRAALFDAAARDFARDAPRLSQGAVTRRGYEIGYGLDRDLLLQLVPPAAGAAAGAAAAGAAPRQRAVSTSAAAQRQLQHEEQWLAALWEAAHRPGAV